ncbi:MAG TPA: hypothetical protein VEB63_12280 [Chitinophagaceae bacterium]|nr:hypothetical protein [Chitinophagaceae bacterium]
MKSWIIRLRTVVLVFLTHRLALPLLRRVRSSPLFTHSVEELRCLPEGSLGNDLYRFLVSRQLQLLPHYARHDLKHVLLGYDTTDLGEASLQFFMLGNGRISFPVLATVIYGALTMPEHWGQLRGAYRRGKTCPPVHDWPWNELIGKPTVELRKKLFVQS